jgi:endonuclease III
MPRAESKTTVERRNRLEQFILPILKRTYPDARCSLDFKTPLQLLVATILSAQCTDERVNLVTKDLFKKYPTAAAYAAAPQEALEKDIQSTGFFRNKAKSLRGMAAALVERHKGKVPETMDELTQLAGVGRKTANVVLGNAYGKSVGVTVDTHVTRVSNRLGLTKHAVDAVKIEQDLMKVVPREDWTMFSHLLIHHGRAICQARKPKCDQCPLLPHCPAGQKFIKTMKPTDE